MKSHFWEKVGVVFGTGAAVAPGAKAANNLAQNNIAPEIHIQAQAPVAKDVTKEAGNFVMNEANEQQSNLKFAMEAQDHVGRGGFVSEKFPGCVLVAENIEPGYGGSSTIKMKAYQVSTDNMNGYRIIDVTFDGKSINENSFVKVESRINNTDPIGLSFTYSMLRGKMNPQEIKTLLEIANPGVNVDLLIKALEQERVNKLDQTEIKEITQDIASLKQATSAQEEGGATAQK